MSNTSFQQSMLLTKAIEKDFQERRREIEAAYETEMAPLRNEYRRKQSEIEARRKNSLAKLTRWRNGLVKQAGVSPVDIETGSW